MNEGVTLIQGNTCLKPKIKSNNSAPVEYEKKKPNQLQKHARIALHYSTPLAQELIGEPKLTEI